MGRHAGNENGRTLDVIQRWFATVIMHPHGVRDGVDSEAAQSLIRLKRDELEKVVTRSPRLSAEDRVRVYASAYYARLLECLGEVYPVTKFTLGDELFDEFAFEYLQRYPSRSYTLNEMGNAFPHFLKDVAGEGDDAARAHWAGFLSQLAAMEWAIGQVFDGPGVEGHKVLQPPDLAQIDPDKWAQAKLNVAPCVNLLAFAYPVNDYFSAARHADEPPAIPQSAATWLALSRCDFIVQRHALSETQYVLLNALMKGDSVAEAIEKAAGLWTESAQALAAALRTWFEAWASEGFFVSIEI